jgi:hypothetical protein
MTMNSAQRLQEPDTRSQSVTGHARVSARDEADASLTSTQRLAPTQRVSEVCSFDSSARGPKLTVQGPGKIVVSEEGDENYGPDQKLAWSSEHTT